MVAAKGFPGGLCKESLGQVSLTHLGAIAWSCAAFGGQGGRINKRSGYRQRNRGGQRMLGTCFGAITLMKS